MKYIFCKKLLFMFIQDHSVITEDKQAEAETEVKYGKHTMFKPLTFSWLQKTSGWGSKGCSLTCSLSLALFTVGLIV